MKKQRYRKSDGISSEINARDPSLFKRRFTLGILAFGIIFLMVGSVLTYWASSAADQSVYNGYSFFQSGQGWTTQIDGQTLTFPVLPKDVASFPSVQFDLDPYPKLYLLFNPDNFTEQSREVAQLRSALLSTGKTIVPACTQSFSCGDLPVLNCTTADAPSLLLEQSDVTGLFASDRCLVLHYAPGQYDSLLVHFLYKYYHILP
ncbi:hypothetical protein HZB00_02400 [Candidatus Woesearchaeota archaeon]|nr:hypothetical protein [Candidatus Woesearchaeota archaeon]